MIGKPANENSFTTEDYLEQLSNNHLVPGLLFEFEPMQAAIAREGGAMAITPQDPWKIVQIAGLPMYCGATTPRARSEIPHWHYNALEVYVVIAGSAEMWVKYHWLKDWQRRIAHEGDMLLIQPGVCHWLRWTSDNGFAWVFRAPNIGGVGRPPAGKQICATCPFWQNGCLGPEGYKPK